MAHLTIKEIFEVIGNAIHAAGENLNADFYHEHSTTGTLGIHTEINDISIERQLHDLTKDYDKEDHIFEVAFPNEYFEDDTINIDASLGIKPSDFLEVKAELRCMDLIQKTYQRWVPDHKVFVSKDLIPIINEALNKLNKVKHVQFLVAGSGKEIAERYVEIWFSESHLPTAVGSFSERFFPMNFNIIEYYADIGNHTVDALIGESKLRGKSRKDICLLRVSYLLYHEFIGWLHNNWPKTYNDFINGKF